MRETSESIGSVLSKVYGDHYFIVRDSVAIIGWVNMSFCWLDSLGVHRGMWVLVD